jgi:anti-sigma factor RsiW
LTAPACDKVLLVQAELDGELDAAAAAALAVHRETCPICQAAAVELARARALVDPQALREAMPAEVRARILASVAAAAAQGGAGAAGPRTLRWAISWWLSLGGFGLGAACAAALAFLLVAPRGPDLPEQIVASHIRALQPGHLEDVASTDQHTVKPWFDGRIDFAPPVKDLAAMQFPLQGGRLDYIAGRPVAALVYQHRKHLIDLFVWPAATATTVPTSAQRQGYNIVHWSANGMALWAVSDLEAGELRQFAEDWRRSP